MKARALTLALAATLLATAAWAKLPPPAPLDEKGKAAAAEKKAKDDATAAQAKVDQAAAEDYAVKNYQESMRKAGKPVPKPTPIPPPAPPAAAAAPAPAAAAKPAGDSAVPKK